MLKKKHEMITMAAVDFYTEGPAVDHYGNIYFTMLSGENIMQVNADGEMLLWAKSSCPNGQIILANGEHLVCDSKLGKVLRFSPQGQLMGAASNETCAGIKVNVPNDLLMDDHGNLYFTDSIRHHGAVFCIAQNGDESLIASGLDYPNGLVLSVDKKNLFVAESYQNRIIRIPLNDEDKPAGDAGVFIDLPQHPSGNPIGNLPDGIAMNSQGIMAIAHYGMAAVHLVSTKGNLIETIDTGLACTSNVYFLDDQTLIVTGGSNEPGPGAVLKIKL
jgi:gluconolactonase